MKKPIIDDYNDEMYRKTLEYQKKYGFELGASPKELTHNNEADAFKHAFMQAVGCYRYGYSLATLGGNYHEAILPNNPSDEKNMDLWNNYAGRQIAKEFAMYYTTRINSPFQLTQEEIETHLADRVMDYMKKGLLITDPKNDPRKFTEAIKNKRIYSLEEYKNNRHKKVLTLENVKSMGREGIKKHSKEIFAQLKELGFPTEEQAKQLVSSGKMEYVHPHDGISTQRYVSSAGKVWVEAYIRSDGTEVEGYYRSKPNADLS